MFKNKIVTLDDGREFYIGDDVTFTNGEQYCVASPYNKNTDELQEEFSVFKLEKDKDNDITLKIVEDIEIIKYIKTIIANKNTN